MYIMRNFSVLLLIQINDDISITEMGIDGIFIFENRMETDIGAV